MPRPAVAGAPPQDPQRVACRRILALAARHPQQRRAGPDADGDAGIVAGPRQRRGSWPSPPMTSRRGEHHSRGSARGCAAGSAGAGYGYGCCPALCLCACSRSAGRRRGRNAGSWRVAARVVVSERPARRPVKRQWRRRLATLRCGSQPQDSSPGGSSR